jgi:site-specific DNA recombinase
MWRHGELVPNALEAPVLRLLFELFIEHRRKKTVAAILNERGYRTRRGAKFGYSTVARLLRDPTAKGIHRVNYTMSPGPKKQWQLKPKEDWVYVRNEPIISEEIWEACNQILDEQEKQEIPRSRRGVKLFSGITYCYCGERMYMPSNSPKYICSQCHNKIPQGDLEEVFRKQLPEIQATMGHLEVQNYTLDRDNGPIDLLSRWEDWDDQEKRKIVEIIIENIIVGKDQIAIHIKPALASL